MEKHLTVFRLEKGFLSASFFCPDRPKDVFWGDFISPWSQFPGLTFLGEATCGQAYIWAPPSIAPLFLYFPDFLSEGLPLLLIDAPLKTLSLGDWWQLVAQGGSARDCQRFCRAWHSFKSVRCFDWLVLEEDLQTLLMAAFTIVGGFLCHMRLPTI